MYFTKEEKNLMFELFDVMTDRCPELNISRFDNEKARQVLWTLFRKLRLELKGF